MTDSEVRQKKKRLQNACDECRRRKVRCDSSTMPGGVCSACQSMRIPCTHHRKSKKRGKKISVPANTGEIKFMVTSILSEIPEEKFPIPEDHESIREVLVDLAKYIRYLERELARSRYPEAKVTKSSITDHNIGSGSGNSPENEESSGNESDESETQDLHEKLANMQVTRLQNRHFGKSSNALWFMQVLGLKKYPDVFRRMEFWSALPFEFCGPAAIRELPLSLDFPDDAHLWELTNIYFTLHHPYYPLLHKSTFEQALSEGLHRRDQDFGQLVLALCAVASRYTNDSRNIPQSHHSSLGLGWKWLQQINLFKGPSVMSPVSLHELQTHCLAICFLQTTSQSDFAWMMNGLSLRLAQQRGLYRRKPDIGKGEPHALENELWKRTFWILMYHDIFMSSSLGRPVAVSIDDYDTEPLVELEDENPGNLGLGQVLDSSTSPVVFWNCYMSLLEILSFAEQTLSSIRRSELSAKLTDSSSNWNQRAVDEINSALSNWLFSIPNHLKWDLQLENATFFAQSSALHVTYYWIQIRVNRLFIPRKGEGPSPAGLSSIAICANAARSCTNVLNVLQRRNAHFACHFPTAGVLYNSAIIFLFNIFRAKELNLRVDLKEEVSDARRCIGFLRNYERTHSACGRLRDILDTIFGNHPLSRPSNEVKLTDLTVSHPRDDRKDNQDPNSSQQVSNTPYEPRISNPNPEDGSQPASTALPSRSSTNPYFTVDFGMLNPTPTRLEQSSVVNPLNPSPASFHTGSGSNLVSPRPVLHDAPVDIRQDLSLHQPDRDLVPGENYSSWGLDTSLPIQPQGGHVQGIDYSTFHAQDGYNAIQVQSSALQDAFSSRPVIDSTSYMNDSYQGPIPDVNEVFQQVAPSVPFLNQAENWDPSTILELNHLFQWYSGHTA